MPPGIKATGDLENFIKYKIENTDADFIKNLHLIVSHPGFDKWVRDTYGGLGTDEDKTTQRATEQADEADKPKDLDKIVAVGSQIGVSYLRGGELRYKLLEDIFDYIWPDNVSRDLPSFIIYRMSNTTSQILRDINSVLKNPNFDIIAKAYKTNKIANPEADEEEQEVSVAADIEYNFRNGGDLQFDPWVDGFRRMLPRGVETLGQYVADKADNFKKHPDFLDQIRYVLEHEKFEEIANAYRAKTEAERISVAAYLVWSWNNGGDEMYDSEIDDFVFKKPEGVDSLDDYIRYKAVISEALLDIRRKLIKEAFNEIRSLYGLENIAYQGQDKLNRILRWVIDDIAYQILTKAYGKEIVYNSENQEKISIDVDSAVEEYIKLLKTALKLKQKLSQDPLLMYFLYGTKKINYRTQDMIKQIFESARQIGAGNTFQTVGEFITIMKKAQWLFGTAQEGGMAVIQGRLRAAGEEVFVRNKKKDGFGFQLRGGKLVISYYDDRYSQQMLDTDFDKVNMARVTVTLARDDLIPAYPRTSDLKLLTKGFNTIISVSVPRKENGLYLNRSAGEKGEIYRTEYSYYGKGATPVYKDENTYNYITGALIKNVRGDIVTEYDYDNPDLAFDYFSEDLEPRPWTVKKDTLIASSGRTYNKKTNQLLTYFRTDSFDIKTHTVSRTVETYAKGDKEKVINTSTETVDLLTGSLIKQVNVSSIGIQTTLTYDYTGKGANIFLGVASKVKETGGTKDKHVALYQLVNVKKLPACKGLIITLKDEHGNTKKFGPNGRLLETTTLTIAGRIFTKIYYDEEAGEEIGRVTISDDGTITSIGIFRGYEQDKETGGYLAAVETIDPEEIGWSQEQAQNFVKELMKLKDKANFKGFDPALDEKQIETRLYAGEKLRKQVKYTAAGKITTTVYYNKKTADELGRIVRSANNNIIGIGKFRKYDYEKEDVEKKYKLAKVDMVDIEKIGWSQEKAEEFAKALKGQDKEAEFKGKFKVNKDLIEERFYSGEKLRTQITETDAGRITTTVYYNTKKTQEVGRVVTSANGTIIDIGIFKGYDENHYAMVDMLDPIRAQLEGGGKAYVDLLKQGKKIYDFTHNPNDKGSKKLSSKLVIKRIYSGEKLISQSTETEAGESTMRVYYNTKTAREMGRIVRNHDLGVIGIGAFTGYDKNGRAHVNMLDPRKVVPNPSLGEEIAEMLKNEVAPGHCFGLQGAHKQLIETRVYSGEKLSRTMNLKVTEVKINEFTTAIEATGVTTGACYNKATAQEVGRIERTQVSDEYEGNVIGIGVFDRYKGEDGFSVIDMIDTRRAGLSDKEIKLMTGALKGGNKIYFKDHNVPDKVVKTREYSGEDLVSEEAFSEAGRVKTIVKYDTAKHAEVGRTTYAKDNSGNMIYEPPRQVGIFMGYDPENGFAIVEMEETLTGRKWTEILNPIGILVDIIYVYDDGVIKHTTQHYDEDWLPTNNTTYLRKLDGSEIYAFSGKFMGYFGGYGNTQFVNELNDYTWQELTNIIGEKKAKIDGVVKDGKLIAQTIETSDFEGIMGLFGIDTSSYTYDYRGGEKDIMKNVFRTDKQNAAIEKRVVSRFGEVKSPDQLSLQDLIRGKPLNLYHNRLTGDAWWELVDKDGVLRANVHGKMIIKDGIRKFQPIAIEVPKHIGMLGHFNIAAGTRTYRYRKAQDELGGYDKEQLILKYENYWNEYQDEQQSLTLEALMGIGLEKYSRMFNKRGELPSPDTLDLDDLVTYKNKKVFKDEGYVIQVRNTPMYQTNIPRLKHATQQLLDARGRTVLGFIGKLEKSGRFTRIKASFSKYDETTIGASRVARRGMTYAVNPNGKVDFKRRVSESYFTGIEQASEGTKLVCAILHNFKTKETWLEGRERGRIVNKYKGKIGEFVNGRFVGCEWSKGAPFIRTGLIISHYDDSEEGLGIIEVADMGQTYALKQDGTYFDNAPFKVSWFKNITDDGDIVNQIVNLKVLESWDETKDPNGLLHSSLVTYEDQSKPLLNLKGILSGKTAGEVWQLISQNKDDARYSFVYTVQEDLNYEYGEMQNGKDVYFGVYDIPDTTATYLLYYPGFPSLGLPKWCYTSSVLKDVNEETGDVTYRLDNNLTGEVSLIIKNNWGLPIKIYTGYFHIIPGGKLPPVFITTKVQDIAYEMWSEFGGHDIADYSKTDWVGEGEPSFTISESWPLMISIDGWVKTQEKMHKKPLVSIVQSKEGFNTYKNRGNKKRIEDEYVSSVTNFDKWGFETTSEKHDIGAYRTLINGQNTSGVDRKNNLIKKQEGEVIAKGFMTNPYFPDKPPEYYMLRKVKYYDVSGIDIFYESVQWIDKYGNLIAEAETRPGGKTNNTYYFNRETDVAYTHSLSASASGQEDLTCTASDVSKTEFLYFYLDDSKITGGDMKYQLTVTDANGKTGKTALINRFWSPVRSNSMHYPNEDNSQQKSTPVFAPYRMEDDYVKLIAVKELLRQGLDIKNIKTISLKYEPRDKSISGEIKLSDLYRLGNVNEQGNLEIDKTIKGNDEIYKDYLGKEVYIGTRGETVVTDGTPAGPKQRNATASKVFGPDFSVYFDGKSVEEPDSTGFNKERTLRVYTDPSGNVPIMVVDGATGNDASIYAAKLDKDMVYVFELNAVTGYFTEDGYDMASLREDMPKWRKIEEFVFLPDVAGKSSEYNRLYNNIFNLITRRIYGELGVVDDQLTSPDITPEKAIEIINGARTHYALLPKRKEVEIPEYTTYTFVKEITEETKKDDIEAFKNSNWKQFQNEQPKLYSRNMYENAIILPALAMLEDQTHAIDLIRIILNEDKLLAKQFVRIKYLDTNSLLFDNYYENLGDPVQSTPEQVGLKTNASFAINVLRYLQLAKYKKGVYSKRHIMALILNMADDILRVFKDPDSNGYLSNPKSTALYTEDQVLVRNMCALLLSPEFREQISKERILKYEIVKNNLTDFIKENLIDSEKNIILRGRWKKNIKVQGKKDPGWEYPKDTNLSFNAFASITDIEGFEDLFGLDADKLYDNMFAFFVVGLDMPEIGMVAGPDISGPMGRQQGDAIFIECLCKFINITRDLMIKHAQMGEKELAQEYKNRLEFYLQNFYKLKTNGLRLLTKSCDGKLKKFNFNSLADLDGLSKEENEKMENLKETDPQLYQDFLDLRFARTLIGIPHAFAMKNGEVVAGGLSTGQWGKTPERITGYKQYSEPYQGDPAASAKELYFSIGFDANKVNEAADKETNIKKIETRKLHRLSAIFGTTGVLSGIFAYSAYHSNSMAMGIFLGIAALVFGVHALLHWATASFIKKAFTKSYIDIRDTNGKEKAIARYNANTKEIEYLTRTGDYVALTEEEAKSPSRAFNLVLYAEIPTFISAKIIRKLIILHERAHMLGLEEFGAYTVPFIGAFTNKAAIKATFGAFGAGLLTLFVRFRDSAAYIISGMHNLYLKLQILFSELFYNLPIAGQKPVEGIFTQVDKTKDMANSVLDNVHNWAIIIKDHWLSPGILDWSIILIGAAAIFIFGYSLLWQWLFKYTWSLPNLIWKRLINRVDYEFRARNINMPPRLKNLLKAFRIYGEATMKEAMERFAVRVIGADDLKGLELTRTADGPIEGMFLENVREIYALIMEWRQREGTILGVNDKKDKFLNGLDEFAIMMSMWMRKIIRDSKPDGKKDKDGEFTRDSNYIWDRLSIYTSEYCYLIRDALIKYINAANLNDANKKLKANNRIIELFKDMGAMERDNEIEIRDIDVYITNKRPDGTDSTMADVRDAMVTDLGMDLKHIREFEDKFDKFKHEEQLSDPPQPYLSEIMDMLPQFLPIIFGIALFYCFGISENIIPAFGKDLLTHMLQYGLLGVPLINKSAVLFLSAALVFLVLGFCTKFLSTSKGDSPIKFLGLDPAGERAFSRNFNRIGKAAWTAFVVSVIIALLSVPAPDIARSVLLKAIIGTLALEGISVAFGSFGNFRILLSNALLLMFHPFIKLVRLDKVLNGTSPKMRLAALFRGSFLFNGKSTLLKTIFYYLRPPSHSGGIRSFLTCCIIVGGLLAGSIIIGLNVSVWFTAAHGLSGDPGRVIIAGIIFINSLYLFGYGLWVMYSTGASAIVNFHWQITALIASVAVLCGAPYPILILPVIVGVFVKAKQLIRLRWIRSEFVTKFVYNFLLGKVLFGDRRGDAKTEVIFPTVERTSSKALEDGPNEATRYYLNEWAELRMNHDQAADLIRKEAGFEKKNLREEEKELKRLFDLLHGRECNRGLALWDIEQLDLDPKLRFAFPAIPDERQDIIKAYRIRLLLSATGGHSIIVAADLVAMAKNFCKRGIGKKIVFTLSSNKYKDAPADDRDEPRPSDVLKGKLRVEIAQRDLLARYLEYLLNGNNTLTPKERANPKNHGTARVGHVWTSIPNKALSMAAADLFYEETPYIRNMLVVDRDTFTGDIDLLTDDIIRARRDPSISNILPQRDTAYRNPHAVVSEASKLIEGGHASTLAGTMAVGGNRSESLATGWFNIQRVPFAEAMYAYGDPKTPVLPPTPKAIAVFLAENMLLSILKSTVVFALLSTFTSLGLPLAAAIGFFIGFRKIIFTLCFGAVIYIAFGIGISEDVWSNQLITRVLVGLGINPKFLLSTFKAHKFRETWSQRYWLNVFIRWAGGLLQKMKSWLVTKHYIYGPASVASKMLHRFGARFFLTAIFSFVNIASIALLISFNLTPYIGINLIFWMLGFIFNQILTGHGCIAYVRGAGFNYQAGFIAGAAAGGLSLFAAKFTLAGALNFALPIGIMVFIIGGFSVGLSRWLATRPRDTILFSMLQIIHIIGIAVRQTLEFSISGEKKHLTEIWPKIKAFLDEPDGRDTKTDPKTLSIGKIVEKTVVSVRTPIIVGAVLTFGNLLVMYFNLDALNIIMLFPTLMVDIGALASAWYTNKKIGFNFTTRIYVLNKALGYISFIFPKLLGWAFSGFAYRYLSGYFVGYFTGPMPNGLTLGIAFILVPVTLWIIGKLLLNAYGEPEKDDTDLSAATRFARGVARFTSDFMRNYMVASLILIWFVIAPMCQSIPFDIFNKEVVISALDIINVLKWPAIAIASIIVYGKIIGVASAFVWRHKYTYLVEKFDARVKKLNNSIALSKAQTLDVGALKSKFEALRHDVLIYASHWDYGDANKRYKEAFRLAYGTIKGTILTLTGWLTFMPTRMLKYCQTNYRAASKHIPILALVGIGLFNAGCVKNLRRLVSQHGAQHLNQAVLSPEKMSLFSQGVNFGLWFVAGLAILSGIIILSYFIWKTFFPASYWVWRLKRCSSDAGKARSIRLLIVDYLSNCLSKPHESISQDTALLKLLNEVFKAENIEVPDKIQAKLIRVLREVFLNPHMASRKIAQNTETGVQELREIYAVLQQSECVQELFSLKSRHSTFIKISREFLNSSENYAKKILNNEVVYPQIVEFHLGKTCDSDCIFCFSKGKEYKPRDNKYGLNKERIFKLIDEFSENGVKALIFSGGKEPFTDEVVMDAVKYAKAKGVEVFINTNGTLLDEEKINQIVANVKRVRVNLSAATPEIYKAIHGANDKRFQKVIDNIKRLVYTKKSQNSDIDIGLCFLVIPQNYRGLPAFVKMAKDLGVDSIDIRTDIWNVAKDFNKSEIKEMTNMLSKIKKMQRQGKLGNLKVDIAERFNILMADTKELPARRKHAKHCWVALVKMVINPWGETYKCCLTADPSSDDRIFQIGDLGAGEKVIDVLKKLKDSTQDFDVSKCPHCRIYENNINLLFDKLNEDRNFGIDIDNQPFMPKTTSSPAEVFKSKQAFERFMPQELKRLLRGHEQDPLSFNLADKVNEYPGILGESENVHKVIKVNEEHIADAAKFVLEGNIINQCIYAGLGTRALNVLDKKPKFMFDPAATDGSLLPISLGARMFIQYRATLEKIAKEYSYDVNKALNNAKFIVHVNELSGDDIVQEFEKYNFFGFNPENILFIIQPAFEGYIADGKGGLIKYTKQVRGTQNSWKRPLGHGYTLMQLVMQNQGFIIRNGLKIAIKEAPLEYFINRSPEVSLVANRAIEDLTKLTDDTINLDKLALRLKLHRQGHGVVVELHDNVDGIKGAYWYYDIKRPDAPFLIEKFQTKNKLFVYSKSENAYYYASESDFDDSKYEKITQKDLSFVDTMAMEFSNLNKNSDSYDINTLLKYLRQKPLPMHLDILKDKEAGGRAVMFMKSVAGDITKIPGINPAAIKSPIEAAAGFKTPYDINRVLDFTRKQDENRDFARIAAGFMDISSEIEKLIRNKNDFSGVENIARIENIIYSKKLLSEEEIEKVKEAFLTVMRDKNADKSVREMAALAARQLADMNVIRSFINLAPEAVAQEKKAIVIYSDTLQNSKALQALVRANEQDKERYYLVFKGKIENAPDFLAEFGLKIDNFAPVIDAESKAPDAIVSLVTDRLAKDINRARVFAEDEEDFNAWAQSRQDIITVLIMLLKTKKFAVVSPDKELKELYERAWREDEILAQA
ncbi:MAG: radical SAM protein [Candidatus Omnitrophota bacterium]